jgi:5-methylcytosine-specific restriction endonuclease McrA
MFKEIDINKKYICPQCGTEDYPQVNQKNVHDEASCPHCNKHYKFLSKKDKYGTKEQQSVIWNKTLGQCAYCACIINPLQDRNYHFDHIEPQINNGSNDVDNLMLSCKTCNTQKGKKSISEYRKYLKSKMNKETWIFFFEILKYSHIGENMQNNYDSAQKLNYTVDNGQPVYKQGEDL